jgi:hypothetical protein
MKGSKENKILYVLFAFLIIILILVILISIFSYNAYNHFNQFSSHQKYLKSENISIESWMPINFVVERFNIPREIIYKKLNITESQNKRLLQKINITDFQSSKRLTIADVCKENNLNCSEVIDELNNLKRV